MNKETPAQQGQGVAKPPVAQSEAVAKLEKNISNQVLTMVHDLQKSNTLHLPPNYSAENALKSGWMKILKTVDKAKRPALDVCTPKSVANALFEMVTMGLNPAKTQCYFIVSGDVLDMRSSYFGKLAIAKRTADVKDAPAVVIYEGDDFAYEFVKGKRVITKHVQPFTNLDNAIIGAYCTIEFNDGTTETDVMTMKEIIQAWKQGYVYSEGGTGTHQKFPPRMCRKTVISRALSYYINSSDDSDLVMSFEEDGEDTRDKLTVTAHEEVETKANQGAIGFDTPTAEELHAPMKNIINKANEEKAAQKDEEAPFK